MEQTKLSDNISLFSFVKDGMIQVEKTWENFQSLYDFYQKNKNSKIEKSNQRMIFDDTEFQISVNQQNKVENTIPKYNFLITLIAAIDKTNVIGIGDKIPWRLSNDMEHFKETTTGHYLIMGRKTFETFGGKPLPNRRSIIITKDVDYGAKLSHQNIDMTNIYVFNDIEECLSFLNRIELIKEVFVIGGGEIYSQMIKIADKLIISEVSTISEKIINLDDEPIPFVYFPDIIKSNWTKADIFCKYFSDDDKNQYPFKIETYFRKNNIEKSVLLNSNLIKKLIVGYVVNKLKLNKIK